MDYKIKTLKSMKIIGLEVITTNQGRKAESDIGNLWNEFFAKNIIEKIPSKVSNSIVNAYMDYESDHNAGYTVVLGCKVENFDSVPDNLVAREIPGGCFAFFDQQGEIPGIVIDTWNDINTSDLKRTYRVDFDLYPEGTENKVQVHVGIED